jgi:TRAP transporter TatT component family protein
MFAVRSSTTSETSAAKPRASKKRSDRARSRRAPTEFPTEADTLRRIRTAGIGALLAMLAAACSVIGSKAADTLSAAILNQDDPELVASGVPAYLLLVDGLISQNPDNTAMLGAGAQLFALYGSRFAASPERAVTLTAKARRYGTRAICLSYEPACHWESIDYDSLVEELGHVSGKHIDALYSYAVGWLSNLDATSEDWSAVAELPWVEAVLDRALMLDETYERGAIHGYLGILESLRPPALGGQPDLAREHFERAIELSEGEDLSIKVEYARRYARLVFDQELHDRLLTEVLSSPTEAPKLTLFNTLAKKEAEGLLATSKEYF